MPPKVAQWIIEQEEQKIFKEFEENGWSWSYKTKYLIYFSRNNIKYRLFEHIMIKEEKTYFTDWDIDMKTHQLLHKLFELWGWFDE